MGRGRAQDANSGRAVRLCPQAILLPSRPKVYTQISAGVLKILLRYADSLEPTSVDEAYLDLSERPGGFGSAPFVAQRIRRAIRGEYGLPASIGIGPTRAIAKIASRMAKPDGIEMFPPERVFSTVHPMPVSAMGGVGEKTAASLRAVGIRTIGQLAETDELWLRRLFGKNGSHMVRMARGVDCDSVTPFQSIPDPKSMSNERTLVRDTSDPETIESTLLHLAEKLARRLRREELVGNTFQLKLRFSDFRTLIRSRVLPDYTNDERTLFILAKEGVTRHREGRPLRLVGIGLSRLVRSALSARVEFADPELGFDRSRRMYRESLPVFDAVRDRFGERMLRKARLL